MGTVSTRNMSEEVSNVIANRRFVLLFLKYWFRHRLGTGIVLKVPVYHQYREKKLNYTHPYIGLREHRNEVHGAKGT